MLVKQKIYEKNSVLTPTNYGINTPFLFTHYSQKIPDTASSVLFFLQCVLWFFIAKKDNLAKAAGIDVAYFGVVFILMTVMGLLTPPVGTVLNVACGAGKINMERMVKSIWPFLLAEVIILLLMVLFPAIVTVPMNFFLG